MKSKRWRTLAACHAWVLSHPTSRTALDRLPLRPSPLSNSLLNMDNCISCVDLGEFDVISKDGCLTLTTGVSLLFRGSEGGEEAIAPDKLHELVSAGLGFSGATSCRITVCPLIHGIPMYQEYLGPDGCGFVQVLAHLVEDLDVRDSGTLPLRPRLTA